MSDYNEHLISQAGGDGPEKMVDVRLIIVSKGKIPHMETLDFTNLPMGRVKDAIDLLNDDHVELIPAPRTEDFTLTELFGMYATIPANNRITTQSSQICGECGAAVYLPQMHLEFHNKLLP